MTLAAIVLVLCASALHALWNVLAKRGIDALVFLWAASVAGSVLLLAPIAVLGTPVNWTPEIALRVTVAAVLRASYFMILAAAYARGDLSLVYPLARGIAPVLTVMFAVALLRETPSPQAIIGVTVIVLGVYATHLERWSLRQMLAPFHALRTPYARFALLTGLITATYSIIDKSNLATGIDPIWYAYLTIPIAGLLLTPLTVRLRPRIVRELRANGASIVAVAVMMPLTYLLVLYALTIAPVSYVVPARELSIVFTTTLGVLWLGERGAARRLGGALLVLVGVVVLSLAR
jgi:drug/metabolite transporter (DMT)-like permease